MSWYAAYVEGEKTNIFFADNYVAGLVNGVPVCKAVDCEERLPWGNEKSCTLPGDTIACYYMAPQTVCTEGECPKVCNFFLKT
jgi:hypothetical protein